MYASISSYDDDVEMIISLNTGDILFSIKGEEYLIMEQSHGLFELHNLEEDKDTYLYFANNKLLYQSDSTVDKVYVNDKYNKILYIKYNDNYKELGKEQSYSYYDALNNKYLDKDPYLGSSNYINKEQEELYGFKEHCENTSCGIMKNNELVVPTNYSVVKYLDINLFNYLKSIGKELVLMSDYDKIDVYNLKDKSLITTFNSQVVLDKDDSTFISYSIKKENKKIIYNLITNKQMTIDDNFRCDIGSNYVILYDDNIDKASYYNIDLELIYEINDY